MDSCGSGVYFPLKIKFLAKRERELTTKFAIARNGCYELLFFGANNFIINISPITTPLNIKIVMNLLF